MTDTLELNLTGRVMMVVYPHGIADPARIRVFMRAVLDVVRHHYPGERPSLVEIEPLVAEQLALLERSLVAAAAARRQPAVEALPPMPPAAVELLDVAELAAEQPQPTQERRPRKWPSQGDGKTAPKSLEDKLQDERKPLRKLLSDDCVRLGLVDTRQATRLIESMLGQMPEQAELAIVEELRRTLQQQVRTAIRRYKGGGPWPTPQAQEDMRQDIASARTVKGILMLTRQILKELRAWEREHGKGGVLGFLGGRRSRIG